MESCRQLSLDMIFEILSRTCLQTLDCSRLVCKEWNSLTYDSKFVQLHAGNTGIVSGYLVRSLDSSQYKLIFISIDGQSSDLSLEFLPRNIKIEASSDQGIFVYTNGRDFTCSPKYYICKPTTKQVEALPNPWVRSLPQNLALVVLSSNPLHYRIIKFSHPPKPDWGYNSSWCEIFDSKIWAWKELINVFFEYGEFLTSSYPATCASGSIHMLTNKDRVLAFDVNSESYHFFPLPTPTLGDYTRKRLVKFKGRLGFTCRAPNGCFELWVMKKSIWKKKLVLNLEEKYKYPIVGAFYNSGVALVVGIRGVSFYNIRNCNPIEVKLENGRPQQIFAFRSDFEPVNLNCRLMLKSS